MVSASGGRLQGGDFLIDQVIHSTTDSSLYDLDQSSIMSFKMACPTVFFHS